MTVLKTSAVVLVSVLLFGLTGCGGSKFGPIGSVSGKLTMDGETLPKGTKVIFMHPLEGHAGFSFTDSEGNYAIEWRREGKTFDGLPVGNYQVMLVPAGTVDIDDMTADEMLAGGPPPAPKMTFPQRFTRGATSGLVFDIVEGENKIDIKIASK